MRLRKMQLGWQARFLFAASFSARAATITGTVKSPDGTPFEGAFVQAQNAKTRMTFMGAVAMRRGTIASRRFCRASIASRFARWATGRTRKRA